MTAELEAMTANQTESRPKKREKFGSYGDKIDTEIDDYIVRVAHINVQTMPREEDDLRMHNLRRWAKETKASIISLPETNWDYNMIHHEERPDTFIPRWFQGTKVISTWLKRDEHDITHERSQQGGVTLVSHSRIAGTINKSGIDQSKLGRWVWQRFQGANHYRTTVISLYFPNNNQRQTGSVYMQQAAVLAQKYPDEQKDVINEYVKDLTDFAEERISEGDQILIMGDFNQDTQRWSSPLIKALMGLGMRNLIEERHKGVKLPPTFERGSHAIDAIWGTSLLSFEAAGHEDFEKTPFSSHCGIWGDLKITSIIGNGMEASVRPAYRRLQTKIPKIKNKYNKIADEQFKSRKLDERWDKLDTAVRHQGYITAEQESQYNAMHLENRRCLIAAERRCSKIRCGMVDFSVKVHDAMGSIICWRLLIAREKLKGKKNRPRSVTVKRRSKKWNFDISQANGLNLEELKLKEAEAVKEYLKVKPKAGTLREEFFSELAFDRSQEDGVKMESHLKQIIHQHNENKMWSRIKAATKKITGGAASYVETKVNNETVRITERGPLEAAITKANKSKLQQTNNIEIRSEPLRSHFGEQGDVNKWEQIHKGTLRLPDDFPAEKGLKLFFERIASNHLPYIDIIPTEEEYNKGWKKMREKTSCAPPIHFGHFRAPAVGSTVSKIHTITSNLPMIAGFVPDLWKECVNTMLVKKINDMRPEKLRLVTLLEPQYLQNTKLVNKSMMAHAEKHNALAPEQYGSRRGKNSRTHCLHKRLLYDRTRLQHSTLVLIANDLKSCYDRIVMMVAYLVLRDYGISEEVAKVVTTCMMEMRHKIRTTYGDSKEYYGGDKWEDGIKPAGNGQGNGDGPGLFTGISSECLDILRKEGYGVEIISAVSQVTLVLCGFAFVDDADITQSGKTVPDAMKKAQETHS